MDAAQRNLDDLADQALLAILRLLEARKGSTPPGATRNRNPSEVFYGRGTEPVEHMVRHVAEFRRKTEASEDATERMIREAEETMVRRNLDAFWCIVDAHGIAMLKEEILLRAPRSDA